MDRTHAPPALTLTLALALAASGCGDEGGRRLGQACEDDSACASGLCYASVCLDPSADTDGDGVSNAREVELGRNPLASDPPSPTDDASTSDGSGGGGGLEAWMLLFDPNVSLRACGDASSGLRSATAFSDEQGRLAVGWPGGDIFLARGTGMVTAGTFELAFGCAPSGSPAGSVSAARVELHYEGTWSFDGGSGIVMIAPSNHEMILLEGYVLAAADGSAIAGAEVGTSLDAATVTTDVRGHFFLETRTAVARGASPYRVTVSAAGYQPLEHEVAGERAFGLGLRLVAAP